MTANEKRILAKKLIEQLIYNTPSEAEQEILAEKIEKLVPDPDVLDHIFWSEEFYDENEKLDIDKLLDKCFDYKSNVIAL